MKGFSRTLNHSITSPRIELSDTKKSGNISLSKTLPRLSTAGTMKRYVPSFSNDQFGKTSPSWTIGSSRKPLVCPDHIPGPSQYEPIHEESFDNIILYKRSRKLNTQNVLRPSTSKPRSSSVDNSASYIDKPSCQYGLRGYKQHHIAAAYNTDYRTSTSNCDFPDLRELNGNSPKNNPKMPIICDRHGVVFFDPPDSPDSGQIQYGNKKSTLSTVAFRIPEKHKTKSDMNTPGPGSYSPKFETAPKMASINRADSKGVFTVQEPNSPGPGSYNVGMSVPKEKSPRQLYLERQEALKKRRADGFYDDED